jgi:hypothetical protein
MCHFKRAELLNLKNTMGTLALVNLVFLAVRGLTAF